MDLKGLIHYWGPRNDVETESKEVSPYISNGNGEEDVHSSNRKNPINIPNLAFTTSITKILTTSLLHDVSNKDIADKESLKIRNNITLEVDNNNNWRQNMLQKQQQQQQQRQQRPQQDDGNVSDFLLDDEEEDVEEHTCVIHSNNSSSFCSCQSKFFTHTNGSSTQTSTMVPNAVCPCESEICLCLPKSVAHDCVPVEGTSYATVESTGNALLKGTSDEIDLVPITTDPARQNGYQRRKPHFSTTSNSNSNAKSSSLFLLQNVLPQLKSPPTATSSTTPFEAVAETTSSTTTTTTATTSSCKFVGSPPAMSPVSSSPSSWSVLQWMAIVVFLGVSVVLSQAYTVHDGKYYLTPFNAALGIILNTIKNSLFWSFLLRSNLVYFYCNF